MLRCNELKSIYVVIDDSFRIKSVAWRLVVSYGDDPTIRRRVSIFPDATGHYWNVSREDSVMMKCVSVATCRQCHISLIPARWPNSTVLYNVYILQTNRLLTGWRHMAHRSVWSIRLHVVSTQTRSALVNNENERKGYHSVLHQFLLEGYDLGTHGSKLPTCCVLVRYDLQHTHNGTLALSWTICRRCRPKNADFLLRCFLNKLKSELVRSYTQGSSVYP